MKKNRKKNAVNIIIIALIACGIGWLCSIFIHIGTEYTNNAQIHQDIVLLSSRVQGYVTEVRFNEFEQVHKGDTLVCIEDSEYRLRLAQANADFRNALAALAAMENSISVTSSNALVNDAAIDETQIQVLNAEKNFKRYENLLENGAVTQQQYDEVKTYYNSLKAKHESTKRQKQSTILVKEEQEQRIEQCKANIDVCRAALDIAKLNLSYTVITAPCDGYTSRKTIQEGALVVPGKSLLSLINSESRWVIANFRETQLAHLQIGNHVEVKVDAYPDMVYEGEVAAISDATGSRYSIIPSDNSTGNFVKVEQRIPVKICFTDKNSITDLQQLKSGMSVECNVHCKD